MAKSLELLNSISGLEIRVVSGSDGSHRGRFIACVGLSGVLEVRVWASWAIHTNVSSHSDVRTSMRLAHDSNNSNS